MRRFLGWLVGILDKGFLGFCNWVEYEILPSASDLWVGLWIVGLLFGVGFVCLWLVQTLGCLAS